MGKENFYLFLDIDGVLWDWKWRMNEIKSGRIKNIGMITQFNPESVNALNEIINYIQKDYECNLVISSSWRTFFEEAKQILEQNGVILPKNVSKTPIIPKPNSRGREIQSYLKQKPNAYNLLIIDDEVKDISRKFSSDNIIKTDIYCESLRAHHLEDWLKKKENLNLNAKY